MSAPSWTHRSTAEPINNIRHAYDYLIHDADSCCKKGRELYPAEVRIEGNGFDIGQLEQLLIILRVNLVWLWLTLPVVPETIPAEPIDDNPLMP